MTIAINGSGTITGISQGGLNDNIITPSELSTGAPSWDSSGNLQFNSGYGSVATAYGCRAWVNFNGTGTVAIRASGNVSSITDNGVGDYTVNFSTAMPDANYSVSGASQWATSGTGSAFIGIRSAATPMATTSCQVGTIGNGSTLTDFVVNCVSFHR